MPGFATSATTDSSDTTSDCVWQSWVIDSGTSASSSDSVWQIWTSADSTVGGTTYQRSYDYYPPEPETEEERQAREERERQRMERLEAARREREEAQRKAQELLKEILDEEQRAQFEETEWFFVISQSGKRYRIRKGWTGNVDELNEEGLIVARYCIHPQMTSIPTEDSLVVQKLMLEADESRFLEIANRRALPAPVAV